jgi:hypothetical protein
MFAVVAALSAGVPYGSSTMYTRLVDAGVVSGVGTFVGKLLDIFNP